MWARSKSPRDHLSDPPRRLVFAFKRRQQRATAIDAPLASRGNLHLVGGPEFAAADGQRLRFTTLWKDDSHVLKIDSLKLTVESALAYSSVCFPQQHGDDRADHRFSLVAAAK